MADDKSVSDDRLREIIAGCEGVTPGPWTYGAQWLCAKVGSGVEARDYLYLAQAPLNDYDSPRWNADMAHVARLDPETVAAICTELLSRRSHQEGWQPIETAPKDGTCIYLAWNSEDWTMAEGMWRGDEWVTSATFYNPDVPHPRMEFREYRPNNPLWWQPLPAAPSPKEGK